MKTMDFTITIKNIPESDLNKFWEENMQWMMKNMGEVAEFSNKVEVDWKYALETHPNGFFQVIAAGFTFQAMKTGVKIVKE